MRFEHFSLVTEHGNTTVYEWRYGEPPLRIEEPPLLIETEAPTGNDGVSCYRRLRLG